MTLLNENNTKIMICCHKACDIPNDTLLFPIHVGKESSDLDLGFQTDNMVNGELCDNISEKNSSYCELTALYWAWKNIKTIYPEIEYIGLFHYRRFFSFDEKLSFQDTIVKKSSFIGEYKINRRKLSRELKNGNIIVAKEICFPYPLHIQYSAAQISNDYRILKEIIHDSYPDYYDEFCRLMEKNNKLSAYNMFIMRINQFEDYCSWLFSVLTEVEKRVPYQHYNTNQKRIFGYMGERLLNLWINKNRIKTVKHNVFFIDDQDNKVDPCIRRIIRNVKMEVSSRLLFSSN